MTNITTADNVLSSDDINFVEHLVTSHNILTDHATQQHWDAISRDSTIETLREENERLRKERQKHLHKRAVAEDQLEMLRVALDLPTCPKCGIVSLPADVEPTQPCIGCEALETEPAND